MKQFFLILLLISACNLGAQDRVQIAGDVTTEGLPLENVHIKNISSQKFTITDTSGKFLLKMKAGDTLLLSHVGFQDRIKFISQEEVQQKSLFLKMLQKPEELKEVLVNEPSKINAVSLGIIPKEIKSLSVNERRLRTAGDFKPIHLLSILGGSLQVDPILNAINGRTKRLKKYIAIEKKQKIIAFLEMHAMDYMKKEMQLTTSEAQLLINFIIEDDRLQDLLDLEKEARLQFFLQDAWYRLKNET
ncbi:MAG: carboxypeptidase-like regulatory domain-containing protein [Salinimicrobium sp.]